MSSIWGNQVKISLFGESHGQGVGVVLDGLPAGIALNEEEIQKEMARRAPGDKLSTPRKEADAYEILSGFVDGHTTGTPLCAMIRNTNTHSKDYSGLRITPRPSHADYTGGVRYQGYNDIRGGGHFSARVTAGLVFAGAVAKQILKTKGIQIGAHLKRIYQTEDASFTTETLTEETFAQLAAQRLPVLQQEVADAMEQAILKTRAEGDSVGGVVETAVIGLPAGFGNPFFDSVESKLAHVLFSVPGVKGVEFGAGFAITELKGSEANDPFCIENGAIKTKTNNNGGINGGITNGMPVIFRVALKPTPSIAKEQQTVNLETMENTTLSVKGRHDPCIAVRGVPVVEAATAVCLLDILAEGGFFHG